ncbi:MAG: radical SAM protein, partial [Desulfofustis sp.]
MTASSTSRILLINPPVALPSEPPAGIARLAGALRAQKVDCRVLDLSLACLLGQFDRAFVPEDRWSSRAWKNRGRNLAQIKSSQLYRSGDRYQRVASDLSRVLNRIGKENGCELSFSNFIDPARSPLVSDDLLACAEHFEQNFFYHQFGPLLRKTLEDYEPDCIGLSLSYLSQAPAGFGIIGFLQHHRPGIKIIVGGGLMTSWMSSPGWDEPFQGLIDVCISGPGEEAVLKLTGKKSPSMLGRFSFDGFAMNRYLCPGVVLPYAASHGCYWQRCSFCPDFAEGSCFTAVKASSARAELKELVDQHGPQLVHLLDNAISPALLRTLAADPLPVPWYGFARFEQDLTDRDFCRALKNSGCVMLKLGLESGSQRVLDQLDKG